MAGCTKSAFGQAFAALLLVLMIGCRSAHHEPSRRLAKDSDIQAKIVGTWTAEIFEGLPGRFSLTFDANNSVRLVRANVSTNETMWRVEQGSVVIAPIDGLTSSSLDHWAIWRVDDHELVFRRGFSLAGPPERFTR
jgi:hypothetical protein